MLQSCVQHGQAESSSASHCAQVGVQSTGTLSVMQKAAVRSTMRQLAQGIAYTHQQGVTHRDIKPENVLLQDNGNIALCDFGISKDIISNAYESTLTLAVAAGTLAYCAPEAGAYAIPLYHMNAVPHAAASCCRKPPVPAMRLLCIHIATAAVMLTCFCTISSIPAMSMQISNLLPIWLLVKADGHMECR